MYNKSIYSIARKRLYIYSIASYSSGFNVQSASPSGKAEDLSGSAILYCTLHHLATYICVCIPLVSFIYTFASTRVPGQLTTFYNKIVQFRIIFNYLYILFNKWEEVSSDNKYSNVTLIFFFYSAHLRINI